MAKGKKTIRQDFAFFQALLKFSTDNRGAIRKGYKQLSKQFLDFNDPELRTDAFLRKPQFEALEIYVFLKKCGDNARAHQLFQQGPGMKVCSQTSRQPAVTARGRVRCCRSWSWKAKSNIRQSSPS